MSIKYTPFRAFAALYLVATLVYTLIRMILWLVAPEALSKLASTGILILPLFLFAFLAAKHAVTPNALPWFVYPELDEDNDPRRLARLPLVAAFAATALGIELIFSLLFYLVGLATNFSAGAHMVVTFGVLYAIVCYKGMGEARGKAKSKKRWVDWIEASPETTVAGVARKRMDEAFEKRNP